MREKQPRERRVDVLGSSCLSNNLAILEEAVRATPKTTQRVVEIQDCMVCIKVFICLLLLSSFRKKIIMFFWVLTI